HRPTSPGECSNFPIVVLVQRLEHGEINQRLATMLLKFQKFSTGGAWPSVEVKRAEAAIERFQDWPLAGGDGTVIDEFGRARSPISWAKPTFTHQCADAVILSKSGYCRHVDVEKIDLGSA